MIGGNGSHQNQIDFGRIDPRIVQALPSRADGQVAGGVGWVGASTLQNARTLHNPVAVAPQLGQVLIGDDVLRDVDARRCNLETG